MIQKVRNAVRITCAELDFTECTNMELYLRQGKTLLTYPLRLVDDHTAEFIVPKADAMRLDAGNAELQFAVTVDGAPAVSRIKSVPVLRLLSEAGYGD